MGFVAIVPAAGLGRRMGADKALVQLGGVPLIVRVVDACLAAGAERVAVVRNAAAAPLPGLPAAVQIVTVPTGGEMRDSLLAAHTALPREPVRVICPVDHALVAADTFAAVGAMAGGGIALPVFGGRPGHPIGIAAAVLDELANAATLRDVIRRDPARVRTVPTGNRHVLDDLDTPADLRAAELALAAVPRSVTEQMHLHRSVRAYRDTPVPRQQIERLVDAARRASTSSFIQAYAVVAVGDGADRARIAELCGNQLHIAQAPWFLAICADLHKLELCCERAQSPLSAHSFELFLQSAVDAALLGQNLQLAAESEGLGACMIGGARNNPLALAALLGLPPRAFVLFGMTLGHAAETPVDRGRMPLPGVLHFERYAAGALAAVLDGADEAMREWARECNARHGGYMGRKVDEQKGWCERMAQSWGRDSRYAKHRASLMAELRQLGFGLE